MKVYYVFLALALLFTTLKVLSVLHAEKTAAKINRADIRIRTGVKPRVVVVHQRWAFVVMAGLWIFWLALFIADR